MVLESKLTRVSNLELVNFCLLFQIVIEFSF